MAEDRTPRSISPAEPLEDVEPTRRVRRRGQRRDERRQRSTRSLDPRLVAAATEDLADSDRRNGLGSKIV
jgi:hypothetical protein